MPTLANMTPLLQVFDIPRAVAFYRDKLGFEVVAHSPAIETTDGPAFDWCMLRRDGTQFMLNTAYEAAERPAERDAARWAGHGHTVLFVDCPELDALHAELADPDGYELCFQHPA